MKYIDMIRNGTKFKMDLDYISKRGSIQYYLDEHITASTYETDIGYAIMLYNNGNVSSCDINNIDSYFRKLTQDDSTDACAIKNMLQSKNQILHDVILMNGV